MVVGICNSPDSCFSKRRRFSVGDSAQALLLKRTRCSESLEAEQQLQGQQHANQQGVVQLGENGDIWHVGGLLELLTGALCAALGADPASVSLPTDESAQVTGGNVSSMTRQDSGATPEPPASPRCCSGAAELTEANLQALFMLPLSASDVAAADEDDRASVMSLSAWVADTQSPRRRCSEVGGGGPRQPLPPFSFPRGGGGGGALWAARRADGCAAAEARWPRMRRLSAGGRL